LFRHVVPGHELERDVVEQGLRNGIEEGGCGGPTVQSKERCPDNAKLLPIEEGEAPPAGLLVSASARRVRPPTHFAAARIEKKVATTADASARAVPSDALATITR